MPRTPSAANSGGLTPILSTSQLAFLVADACEARDAKLTAGSWEDLGPAGDEIKKAIADQNIDLADPGVSVTICAVTFGGSPAGLVDVKYAGGGIAPDPFRFIYFASAGKYIGNVGEVASRDRPLG